MWNSWLRPGHEFLVSALCQHKAGNILQWKYGACGAAFDGFLRHAEHDTTGFILGDRVVDTGYQLVPAAHVQEFLLRLMGNAIQGVHALDKLFMVGKKPISQTEYDARFHSKSIQGKKKA